MWVSQVAGHPKVKLPSQDPSSTEDRARMTRHERQEGLQPLLHHQFRLQLPLRAAYCGTEVRTDAVGWPRMLNAVAEAHHRLHGDSKNVNLHPSSTAIEPSPPSPKVEHGPRLEAMEAGHKQHPAPSQANVREGLHHPAEALHHLSHHSPLRMGRRTWCRSTAAGRRASKLDESVRRQPTRSADGAASTASRRELGASSARAFSNIPEHSAGSRCSEHSTHAQKPATSSSNTNPTLPRYV
jgi:hypothetical protein